MDRERRRQLKAAGKAEVEQRSAQLRAAVADSNPAPVGSAEWVVGYKSGTQRERWLRKKLPVLHRAELESMFVVLPNESAGLVAHPGGYLLCTICGSAAPSVLPGRWFYWASCACGNIQLRRVLFWKRVRVTDGASIVPVKLIGKG